MQVEGFETLKVSVEQEGRCVVLEFDHGKANEMGSEQLREIEQLVHQLTVDRAAVALVSFSRRRSRRGTPIFVAGANVTERAGWSDHAVKQHVRWQRRVHSDALEDGVRWPPCEDQTSTGELCRRRNLVSALQITPGKRSPTVSPLEDPEWVAVAAMIDKKKTSDIMDELERLGATDILVFAIDNCRV